MTKQTALTHPQRSVLLEAPGVWERIPTVWNAVSRTHRALVRLGLIETCRQIGERPVNLYRVTQAGQDLRATFPEWRP